MADSASLMAATTIWVVWVLMCFAAALSIYRRRERGEFYQEHQFLILTILMLALAPSVLLITYFLTGSASPSQIIIHLVLAVLLMLAFARARHRRLNLTNTDSAQTFHEKSALLVVVGQLIVFGGYFYSTWNSCLETAIPAFVGSVVMLIIILIAGHILIALLHSPIGDLNEPADERDRLILLRSSRNAGWITSLGFWSIPVMALAPLSMHHVLNIWLAVLVLSSVIQYGSIAAYYRFGVQ